MINKNETACDVYVYHAMDTVGHTPAIKHASKDSWYLIHDARGGSISDIKVYDTNIEVAFDKITNMSFKVSSTNPVWQRYINDHKYGNGMTYVVVMEYNSTAVLYFGRVLTWGLNRDSVNDEFLLEAESARAFANDDVWGSDYGDLSPGSVFAHTRIYDELRYVHDCFVKRYVSDVNLPVSDINTNYRNKSSIMELMKRLEDVSGNMFYFVPHFDSTTETIKVSLDFVIPTSFNETEHLYFDTRSNIVDYGYGLDLTDTVSRVTVVGQNGTVATADNPDSNFKQNYGFRAKVYKDERYSTGLSDWAKSLMNQHGRPSVSLSMTVHDVNMSVFEFKTKLHSRFTFTDTKYNITQQGNVNTIKVTLESLTTPVLEFVDLSENVYSDVKLIYT